MSKQMRAVYTRRGRKRHKYFQIKLRQTFKYVNGLRIDTPFYIKSFIPAIRSKLLPTTASDIKLIIDVEVPVRGLQNSRKIDAIMYIPHVTLFMIEYKTTEKKRVKPKNYYDQVNDTFVKLCNLLKSKEWEGGGIPYIDVFAVLIISYITNKKHARDETFIVKHDKTPPYRLKSSP